MTMRPAVATKSSSVALKLRTSTSVSIWMGDHQGRLGAVNLWTCGPFVGVDLNLWPTVCIAVCSRRADTDVKSNESNQTAIHVRHVDTCQRLSSCWTPKSSRAFHGRHSSISDGLLIFIFIMSNDSEHCNKINNKIKELDRFAAVICVTDSFSSGA